MDEQLFMIIKSIILILAGVFGVIHGFKKGGSFLGKRKKKVTDDDAVREVN